MAEDETLPSDFRNALAPVYTLSMEAEGIMANQGWTERFEAMGFDAETASKIAMTLPALYGATKGAKGPTSATATAQTVKPQTLDPRYANDTWKPIKRYQLVEKDGVWYTVGESGSMFRAKGTYDYVTIGGKVYVSRTSSKEGDVGHYDISRGASQVDYAGSVKFGWSEGTRGVLQGFDNSSGHYKPSANNANQSGLPLDKFREHSAK